MVENVEDMKIDVQMVSAQTGKRADVELVFTAGIFAQADDHFADEVFKGGAGECGVFSGWFQCWASAAKAAIQFCDLRHG